MVIYIYILCCLDSTKNALHSKVYLHPIHEFIICIAIIAFQVILVQSHEDNINDDAEGDEQLCECIKDEDSQQLGKTNPQPRAIPYTQNFAPFKCFLFNLLTLGTNLVD